MDLACHFRSEPVKEADGSVMTRECGPCGTKTRLKVFECLHSARKPESGQELVTFDDCRPCEYRPKPTENARALILLNKLSPGDVCVMTAAIHSLHKQHPGKFITAVDTTCNALFEHNPNVVSIERAHELKAEELQTHYPAIHQSNQRAIHFMQGYCEFLAEALGVPVPLLTNRPHLYLSRKERGWMNQVDEILKRRAPYWIISAGRKADFTTKFAGTEKFQRVVDILKGRVLFVQVGESHHHHPPLKNVLNLVGKTDTRQLVRLAYHAQGGVGGVTFIQHVMAAWEKPYVCLLGGREPVTWNSYPKQHTMHTIGALPCCQSSGCWRSRTVRLNDGAKEDHSLCDFPVLGDEPIPKCMALIREEEIAARVLDLATMSA